VRAGSSGSDVGTAAVDAAAEEEGLSELAARVRPLKNEGAYAVLAAAQALERQGRNIVHLEIGQPAYPTPPHVVAAGKAAIDAGQTKYCAPGGTLELKQEVAKYVQRTRGGEPVTPEQVVVGPGAKPGLFFPALALIEPGDEVLYPDPGFPTYEAMVHVAGGVPKPVPLTADGASLQMDALRGALSSRTKLLVLNSPNNPTGGVMPQADVEEVARLAKEHDFWVLTDEIYTRLVYDGQVPASVFTVEGMRERSVLVDGFSKTYCMTGWRLGWMVMPAWLAKRVELLLVHSVGCTATFTQAAGVAALTGPQSSVEQMVEDYREKRDFVVRAMNDIPGVSCAVPQGAFYAFPDISGLGRSCQEVADYLLEEGGVAVLPGTDFGANGEGHIRISYVCDMDTLQEGCQRIARALQKLQGS